MLNRVTRLPQRGAQGWRCRCFTRICGSGIFHQLGSVIALSCTIMRVIKFCSGLVLADWRYALIALHLRLTVLSVIHDG